MNKELVVIVSTEAAAYKVLTALQGLDAEGSLELYASTVIGRNTDGTIAVKDSRNQHAPWGTVVGASGGALIGLLAGPAGAAIGGAIGAVVGLGSDVSYSGFPGDFVFEVAGQLQPGTFAVIASVMEDWTMPVDAALAPFGATVLRQATDEVVTAQLAAEDQALKDEWAHFESEVASATGEAKAKLEAKREALRASQAAARQRMRTRAEALQGRWDARMSSIQGKVSGAKSDAKVRHQRHHDKLARFAEAQRRSFKDLFSTTTAA
jgi:uncharacterized membrane protein